LTSFGKKLLQSVIRDHDLIEDEGRYFGLVYEDKNGNKSFLDPDKQIRGQTPSKYTIIFFIRSSKF